MESPKDSIAGQGGVVRNDKIALPLLECFNVASSVWLVGLKVFAYEDSWPLFCSAGIVEDRHCVHQTKKSPFFSSSLPPLQSFSRSARLIFIVQTACHVGELYLPRHWSHKVIVVSALKHWSLVFLFLFLVSIKPLTGLL